MNPEQGGIKQTLITPEEKAKKEQTILKEQKRRERMRQLAQRTWDESKPISDTVVESYLKKHRKIMVDVNKIEVRYHPKVPNIISYNNNQLRIGDRRPAMVVSFLNDQNELTGIQCTYLDKVTQNKDKSVQIPKCTIGQVWGGAGIIFKGGEEKVIVSEGAETAMSLIHCEPKSTIYITGGNMQNIQHFDYLALQHDEKEIYIAADNDLSENSGSWKATEAGARKLAEKGIKPIVSQPDAIKGQKTDFNDVMKEYDSREVKRQFSPKYFFDPQCNITDDTKMCSIDLTPKSAKRTTKNNSFKVPDLKLRSHTLDTENKDIIKER